MYQFQVRQVTRECFSALGRIRDIDATNMPAPEVLYAKLRQSIDTMKAQAAQFGMPREDVYDITYAIVAHADEIALNSTTVIQHYWMQQPLQLHYFHETAAGQGFFTRLNAVRADPKRIEVLRVFYLCLLFGFQGSHRVRGGEIALMNLIEEIRYQIARVEPAVELLSPRGYRPEEVVYAAQSNVPLVLAGLGTLVLSIVFFFVFQSTLSGDLDTLDKKVQSLMAPKIAIPSKTDLPTKETKAPVPGSEFGEATR